MVKCPDCGSNMHKMYPDLKGIENYEMMRTFICDNCKHIKQLSPKEILEEFTRKKGVNKLIKEYIKFKEGIKR